VWLFHDGERHPADETTRSKTLQDRARAVLWDAQGALGISFGFTRFARGARAILDADRNLYQGRHVAVVRQIFQDQGIGPVG
jgi:hypothetical protein